MRFKLPSLVASLVGLGLLAGCGGGGGTGGSAGSATLKGVVLTADGTTDALGGYAFRVVETGRRAVSNTEGQFDLGTVPTGQLTVELDGFGTIQAPVLQKDGVDDNPSGDDDGTDDQGGGNDDDGPNHDVGDDHGGDDDDFEDEQGIVSDDDSITIVAVRDGESMVLEVRIDGGRLSESGCSRSRDDRREVESRLARAGTSDDNDITGEIEVRSQSDREKFKVEVEHATAGRVLEVFVIDDGGTEESQGTRTVSSFGEAEWELATNDGARLPFDVTAVAELEGFVVEVRDASTGLVLLRGEVPEMPAAAPGGDDDGGSGGDDDERTRGRAQLTAHESGLEGYVEIRSRPDDNRERFQMEAEHLASGRTVEYFIENALGSATFVSLGTRTAGSFGEAELELDTGDGDTLPLGVTSAGDLTGFAVEVRDASTNALLLSGVVPVAHED